MFCCLCPQPKIGKTREDMKNQKQYRLQVMDYPTINFESLDVTNVDKSCIVDGFCNNVSISIKSADNKMFCSLVSKYVKQNGRDDTVENQTDKLDLIVDDSRGERKYYIGALIEIQEDDPVYESVEIYPTIQEQATIELVLLKVTNPEQFWLKYSRSRVGNLQGIKNKLGLVIDEIDEHDLYKSTWISPDYKICTLGCIPNAHNKDSKIQLLTFGKNDKKYTA